MTTLHVFKSEPDKITTTLVDLVSASDDKREFNLYGEKPDYEGLIDQIFECDKIICWW
jgi:hypothetical protein